MKKYLIIIILFFAFLFLKGSHSVQATHLLGASCIGPQRQELLNECQNQGTAICTLNCNQSTGTWLCNPTGCRDSIQGPCPATLPPGTTCTPIVPRCGACNNSASFSCHTCTAAGVPIGTASCERRGLPTCHLYQNQTNGQCGQSEVMGAECNTGECAPTPIVPTATPTLVPTVPPSPSICSAGGCEVCTSPATCTVGQMCRKVNGPQNAMCSNEPFIGKSAGYCYPDVSCNAQATAIPTQPPAPTSAPTPVPTDNPNACVEGVTQCSQTSCNGNVAQCSPTCNGGWCNGGVCSTCKYVPSGPPRCVKGATCDCKNNAVSCSISFPDGTTGVCLKESKTPPTWSITSCGPAVATPTPTYIPVTLATTPTPKPKTPNSPAQSWKCLKAEPYTGDILPDGKNADHRLILSGSGLPNSPTKLYIVGCVLLGGNFQCTTGNATYDNFLQIQKASEHQFSVSGGSLQFATGNAISNIIVRSKTDTSTTHTFFAVYDPNDTGTQNNQSGSSLQFGTMTSSTSSNTTRCLAVRWDPYGRIFDAKSLEPVPNINIEVLNESKQLVKLPGLTNPGTTNFGGEFKFLVEPGTYFLNPINLKNYKVVPESSLTPDYKKAYFDIYTPGSPIIEKEGVPEHRDIAIDPQGNKPYQSDPKSIEFTVLPVPDTNQTKLLGQVSHPLTLVYFNQNNKQIGTTVADRFGFYELQIDNTNITPGVPIVPAFKKVPLTKILPYNQTTWDKITAFFQSFFKKTSAAPQEATGAAVDPIPSYLQGYIYGGFNTKLKHATVQLIRKMSDVSVYQTQTDENGLLKIDHMYMPIFPMYLRITPEGSTDSFDMTITDFMTKNKDYFQQNNIDLMLSNQ